MTNEKSTAILDVRKRKRKKRKKKGVETMIVFLLILIVCCLMFGGEATANGLGKIVDGILILVVVVSLVSCMARIF